MEKSLRDITTQVVADVFYPGDEAALNALRDSARKMIGNLDQMQECCELTEEEEAFLCAVEQSPLPEHLTTNWHGV